MLTEQEKREIGLVLVKNVGRYFVNEWVIDMGKRKGIMKKWLDYDLSSQASELEALCQAAAFAINLIEKEKGK